VSAGVGGVASRWVSGTPRPTPMLPLTPYPLAPLLRRRIRLLFHTRAATISSRVCVDSFVEPSRYWPTASETKDIRIENIVRAQQLFVNTHLSQGVAIIYLCTPGSRIIPRRLKYS